MILREGSQSGLARLGMGTADYFQRTRVFTPQLIWRGVLFVYYTGTFNPKQAHHQRRSALTVSVIVLPYPFACRIMVCVTIVSLHDTARQAQMLSEGVVSNRVAVSSR